MQGARLRPRCRPALKQLGSFLIKQPEEFLQPVPVLGHTTRGTAAAGAGVTQAAVAWVRVALSTLPQSGDLCCAVLAGSGKTQAPH